MDYDKTFVYSKILLETANKNLPSYDNEYYKSEAIKFIMDLIKNNSEKAKQYFKNIFIYNFESVILNTSFYFLSAEKGIWRDGDGNLISINNMDTSYIKNCIKFITDQIMSVERHRYYSEFDNKFIYYIIKNDTYDIGISKELLNEIKFINNFLIINFIFLTILIL